MVRLAGSVCNTLCENLPKVGVADILNNSKDLTSHHWFPNSHPISQISADLVSIVAMDRPFVAPQAA